MKIINLLCICIFAIAGSITGQDNIGIGTTNPQYPLHLYKNSSNHIYMSFSNLTTGSAIGDGVLVGLDPAENFRIHSYENNNLQFHTGGDQRMLITPLGYIGINTPSPIDKLHVTGGTILNGDLTIGMTDQTANGVLAFFNKARGAFRTGQITNTYWQPDSLGQYSFASGYNTKAKGSYSFATGYQTEAIGSYSVAFGSYTDATGIYSTSFGRSTDASGSYSLASGYNTNALGSYSTAMGRETTAYSGYETVIGYRNESYTPLSATGWNSQDRLFVIGNGGAVSTNAMTVLKNGNVGIGTSTPDEKFHLNSAASDVSLKVSSGAGDQTFLKLFEYNDYGFEFEYNGADDRLHLWSRKYSGNEGIRMTWKKDGFVGINYTDPQEGLHLRSRNLLIDDISSNDAVKLIANGVGGAGEIDVYDGDGTATIRLKGAESASTGAEVSLKNASGVESITLDAEYGTGGPGRISTDELEIKGGSDLSEYFNIKKNDDSPDIQPGMVVCIDPSGSGALCVSTQPYDPAVAGIVSGANGIRTGLMMGQRSSVADGDTPVVLSGRAYVFADATKNPIRPGDLLTTSERPGHAMKVLRNKKAQGAIIGKAMTALDSGTGFVLVLVNLQ